MDIQKEQFTECIQQYENLIITICFRFTRNYFDAEDLAQETFLSAYKNWERFDGNNLKAWLTSIAANKCRDYLKNPAKKAECFSQDDLDYLEDTRMNPESAAMEKDMEHHIYSLCQSLKEPYKSISTAYFCRNERLSDIAEKTGKSLKTLQTQLYRSKKLLKILWKEGLK